MQISPQARKLLHPSVVQWMVEQEWTGLRPIQEQAIPPIVEGKSDVILSASTASGKTEAAFLPVLSHIAANREPGIRVIYISPLKALINDQYRRISSLCHSLHIPAMAWHGDVSWQDKQDFLMMPDGVLLITPESLESLLCSRNGWCHQSVRNLSYLIIDEFHAFLDTSRGRQLQSLMQRIDALVHHPVPRIALSATLASPEQAKKILRVKSTFPCCLVTDVNEGNSTIQIRGYRMPPFYAAGKTTSPTGQKHSRMLWDLFTLHQSGSHLIFTNSRARTEEIARELRNCCRESSVENFFFPHHGSLARSFREDVEQQLAQGKVPLTVVCTMTLELGIDIGNMDTIAQVGAPTSVAGLKQRCGRAGRRGQEQLLRMFIQENDIVARSSLQDRLRLDLFQALATVRLLNEQWCEPAAEHRFHFSTLIQQILSTLAQYKKIRPSQMWCLLCEKGPFPVDQDLFLKLVKGMAVQKLVRRSEDKCIVLDDRGLALTRQGNFTAAFRTPEEYTLFCDKRPVGTLPITDPLEEGQRILFSGRSWRITGIDEAKHAIALSPSTDGTAPRFSGLGQAVHDRVREIMRDIYRAGKAPDCCDSQARQLFDEGVRAYRSHGLEYTTIVPTGTTVSLVPWMGDRGTRTIAGLLRLAGLDASDYNGIIDIRDTTKDTVRHALRRLVAKGRPEPGQLVSRLSEKLFDKYDHLVPEELRILDICERFFDLDRAWTWLVRLAD